MRRDLCISLLQLAHRQLNCKFSYRLDSHQFVLKHSQNCVDLTPDLCNQQICQTFHVYKQSMERKNAVDRIVDSNKPVEAPTQVAEKSIADFSGDEALKFAVQKAKNIRTRFLGDQIMPLLLKAPLISGYPTPNKPENNKRFNWHSYLWIYKLDLSAWALSAMWSSNSCIAISSGD